MSFDGVFIHYLVDELNNELKNNRINKFNAINDSEFFLTMSNHKTFFISVNSNNPHLRITNSSLVNSSKLSNFENTLKKYLTSSVITSIEQFDNDRIIIIKLVCFDDLGYQKNISLVLEMFGRNSNALLLDNNDIIIDCYKRKLPTEEANITAIPKMKYAFVKTKINPFIEEGSLLINDYCGVSNFLFQEIQYKNNINVINSKVNPCLMSIGKKKYFYAFPLTFIDFQYMYFSTLSELLEEFYSIIKNDNYLNNEQTFLNSYIKKEIEKNKVKLYKQNEELETAYKNLDCERIGNLLASNIYLVKKGMNYIEVNDFYNNNNLVKINLNPLLTPNKNLESVFNKFKKAKRTIEHLKEQLIYTQNDIAYFECLLEQLSLAKNNELKEIYQELNIKDKHQKKVKMTKPNITVYEWNDAIIYVGKNNIQNNYLTNKFANYNDYFFHVQGVPGSHTILRSPHISDDLIEFVATIAACYSKYKNSSNVAVDYTLIKYVKKIKGNKGSFVSYTNQKTVFVTPNIELIKQFQK